MKNYSKTFLIILFVSFFISSISQPVKNDANLKVLAVTPDKLGANFNFNIDNLEYLGWDVTWVGFG